MSDFEAWHKKAHPKPPGELVPKWWIQERKLMAEAWDQGQEVLLAGIDKRDNGCGHVCMECLGWGGEW